MRSVTRRVNTRRRFILTRQRKPRRRPIRYDDDDEFIDDEYGVDEYVHAPQRRASNSFNYLKTKSSLNDFDRESIWKGVQRPEQVNMPASFPSYSVSYTNSTQPMSGPMAIQTGAHAFATPASTPYLLVPATGNQSNGVHVIGRPTTTPQAEYYYDAADTTVRQSRRPTDGEADSDRRLSRWTLDRVLNFLERMPGQARRSILTGLFGTALGIVLDIILGGSLGLTSTVFRLLLRFVPGGSLILTGIDGLAYLFSRISNPFNVESDPSFADLAAHVQEQMPAGTSEALTQVAEAQLGQGIGRQLGAVAGAALTSVANLQRALPAVLPLMQLRRE